MGRSWSYSQKPPHPATLEIYRRNTLMLTVRDPHATILDPVLVAPEMDSVVVRIFNPTSGSGLVAINYETGKLKKLVDGISPSRASRCGNKAVFWELGNNRHAKDVLVMQLDGGAYRFLSVHDYNLGFATCSDGALYLGGKKGWYNILTEGYHISDVRLFRYSLANDKIQASGSILKSDLGVGFARRAVLSRWPDENGAGYSLMGLTSDAAYEIAGSASHSPELMNNMICREPRSDISESFGKN